MKRIDDQGYGYPLKSDNIRVKMHKYLMLFMYKYNLIF